MHPTYVVDRQWVDRPCPTHVASRVSTPRVWSGLVSSGCGIRTRGCHRVAVRPQPGANCECASDARLDASRGGRGGGRLRPRRRRRPRRRPRARTRRRWGGVAGSAHRAGTFARRASGVERRGTRITREGAVGWTRGRKGRGETRRARARDCVERTRRRVRDRGWSTLSEDASRRRDSGRRSGRARGRGRRGEREESAAR